MTTAQALAPLLKDRHRRQLEERHSHNKVIRPPKPKRARLLKSSALGPTPWRPLSRNSWTTSPLSPLELREASRLAQRKCSGRHPGKRNKVGYGGLITARAVECIVLSRGMRYSRHAADALLQLPTFTLSCVATGGELLL